MKNIVCFRGTASTDHTTDMSKSGSRGQGHIMGRGGAAFVTTLLAELMLLLLLTAGAGAASFTVDNNCDDTDTTCGGGNQFIGHCNPDVGDSGGKCTLRAAIKAGNALGGGDHIILLKDTTYTLTSTLPTIAKVMSKIPIAKSVTIQGVSAGKTTIQRPCVESARDEEGECSTPYGEFRIFNVAPGAALSLFRVTVRGGQANLGGNI